jgi:hypothetical protein
MTYFKEEWQVDVLEEEAELRKNLGKLIVFMDQKKKELSHVSFALLKQQRAAMERYLEILNRRIRHWDN